jgi:hypothetical protein
MSAGEREPLQPAPVALRRAAALPQYRTCLQ